MDLYAIIDQIASFLQQRGRLAYRALKLQFHLDEEQLAAVKAELIDTQEVAVDKDGTMLVWRGTPREQLAGSPQHPEVEAPQLQRALPAEAERRQLTVMFCDLVGSTALSAQLDPEEYRQVVQQYQDTCTVVIRRYEGQTAQHLGDGLLVYFGYPTAHEDDAARAVRTAMEIIQALKEQIPGNGRPDRQDPLQVRIGIHTGLVVIGEIGSSEKREMLALGETPNVAARLQGLAEPDTIVISAVTQRLVAGLFESQELGPQTLKGVAAPLVLYRVIREAEAQSRFEVAVRTGLTPLIGREEELALLRRRWEQAKEGEGQVVLLSGEAGIGKSRLVQEMKERLSAVGATRIEFRCSPYHQNSAFHPILAHLQRLLQFAADDPPPTKLTKLQQALTHYRFPQIETLPLLAALLSLPQPDGVPPLTWSPQKQKEKTQEALVAWLMEETARQAVYLVWEDLHWIDPSSLEVLTLILQQVPTSRSLVVLTYRPDFTAPWRPRAYSTHFTLSRLGQQQVTAMVNQVMAKAVLADEVIRQIVSRTDGVPLFVEEITKSVVESLGMHDRVSLPFSAIPATLHDSLMARLDRLGAAKTIAQLGATLGREFSYELLQAVALVDAPVLQHSLQQLVDAELLCQRGLPPQATYLFKHALIQDAAYQSLLKNTRQQYHHRIAQVLEMRFPETVETQPELLAHHYTEAGLVSQAVPCWQKAGQNASRRSAHVEAISHLRKGLEVLMALPDTPERAQQELSLQMALTAPLMATKGLAASEGGNAYDRALELCQQLGETPQLFPVLRGLIVFLSARAEHKKARPLAEQCLRLAQSTRDSALLMEAHYVMGNNLFYFGEFVLAREHFEQSIALYDSRQHHSHAFLYGQDTQVVCFARLAWTLCFLGYPDQGLKLGHRAITQAKELSHPHSIAYALSSVPVTHQCRREGQSAQEHAGAAIALATEQGFTQWVGWGTVLEGWACAEQGREQEGIVRMRQGQVAFLGTGAESARSYLLALLVEAYEKTTQIEEGMSVVTEALEIAHKNDERWYEAEIYRLKGELLLAQESLGLRAKGSREKTEEAEGCFLRAIEIARKQQAKSLELRASTSLARLWQQQGKQHEAHRLLSEVYNWFTEGFDTKDLQEAKALLDELAGER